MFDFEFRLCLGCDLAISDVVFCPHEDEVGVWVHLYNVWMCTHANTVYKCFRHQSADFVIVYEFRLCSACDLTIGDMCIFST